MAAWQAAARGFNVEGAAVDERNKAEGTQQMLEKLKPLRTIYQGDNSFAIRRCLLGIFPIDSGKLLSGGLRRILACPRIPTFRFIARACQTSRVTWPTPQACNSLPSTLRVICTPPH